MASTFWTTLTSRKTCGISLFMYCMLLGILYVINYMFDIVGFNNEKVITIGRIIFGIATCIIMYRLFIDSSGNNTNNNYSPPPQPPNV